VSESNVIRVLIADDHTILREGIKSLLSGQDHIEVVGEADDGKQALEKVRKLEPDVTLMDISMPNINGIEATKQITDEFADVKVLILTMHDQEGYVYPIFKAGASGYVVKRSATRELVSAIEAVVEGNTVMPPEIAQSLVEDESVDLPEDSATSDYEEEDYDGLTDRELEVLTLVAEGLTNQEIADNLHISIKTVQAHRANIMEKLQVRDRVDLTKYAIRKGLISL